MAAPPVPLLRSFAPLTVLVLSTFVTLFAYRIAADSNRSRIETEFYRRSDIRHTLTREVLNYYDAGLFGLRNRFLADQIPTRAEFDHITTEIIARYPGIATLEWAPIVPGPERAAFEDQMTAELGRPVHITRTEGGTRLVPIEQKDRYAPVRYVSPSAGKEVVFGFDITTGLIANAVERARAERTMIVSPAVKLIEKPDLNRIGLVWIWPIFRGAGPSPPLAGYVLGVFRLSDMLNESLRHNAASLIDALYLDPAEADPARRAFYYQPGDAKAAVANWPTEAEFRSSAFLREQPIPIGGRTWQVLYRPRPGWMEETGGDLSLWLLAVGLVGSTALTGWVFQVTRRAALVEQLVQDRTREVIESRRELAGFVHALPGMAFRGRYDDKFTLFYVSEGSTALTGYAPEDFLAGRIHLRDLVHPDDLVRVRNATRAAVNASRPLEVEYRIRTREAGEKWVLSRGRGRHAETEAESFNYFEGLVIDITAQKRTEQERLGLERKLLESQKLESLGLLAGGVAHDFNNLLTGILGNANLARLTLPSGSSVHSHLHAIETASLRAAELCRQMLAYAGKGRFVVEPVDLSGLAEGLVPLLKISVGHRAELRLKLTPKLPPVMADATQLRQIVMNLVLNAADATSGRTGTITITSGVVHADLAFLARCSAGADCAPGDYVFLEVRDNGVGMTPEVRAKIFDPFFTTKFAGRGLGLAAALGIVRSHQGALQVESTPGEGSSFRLLLPPAATPDAKPAAPCAPAPSDWRRTGVALLIDDEEPVRQVGAEILASFGLTPRIAADGETGLAIFRENPAAIDVVLLDLVMPGLNGEQTLEQLRAMRREVRVLLVSGFTEGELLRRFGPERGRLAFLSKPFTREALADKLRELLG